ncbi:MAG: extracellular solute-binding protein [Caldilineaceae bacterium]|nr:extracellular solute-binding protein [Caldilineaceae bacterium]
MKRKPITRRSFLKGIAVTGLGAASAQLLAACAAPTAAPGTTTEEGAAPSAESVTLRIQAPAGNLALTPQEFAPQFKDETGVDIVIEETIYGEIETKTQTGFIAGTLQDLLYGHHRWIFINFVKGIYLELDDFWASSPPPDPDDFYPSVLEGNKWEGKSFNLPDVVHPGGNIALAYNKTMLEEKGLPIPEIGWTIDDWTELARGAADPDAGIFGMGFDSMSAMHYYSNTSRSFGAPDSTASWIMDEEGRTMSYNTDLHGEIAAWYVSLLDDKVAPRNADKEGVEPSLFVAGLQATHASTVGVLTSAQDQAGDRFEVGAIPLPPGPEGRQGTCFSGNQWMINSNSAAPDAAWEFAKLITSTEAGIFNVLEAKRQTNGRKSVWTNPEVNAVNPLYGFTDKVLTEGIEPYPMPWNTRFTEANNIFQAEIDLIWEGEQTFAEYAAEVERKTQAVLDEDMPS